MALGSIDLPVNALFYFVDFFDNNPCKAVGQHYSRFRTDNEYRYPLLSRIFSRDTLQSLLLYEYDDNYAQKHFQTNARLTIHSTCFSLSHLYSNQTEQFIVRALRGDHALSVSIVA